MRFDRNRNAILHLIETGGPGGAENVLISLACGLNQKRFRSIVCLKKHGWLYDELTRRGVETRVIKEKGFLDVGFILKLLVLAMRERISLIHAHEFLMNVYGALVGSLSARPVVTTVHGKNYYSEKMRRRLAMQFVSRYSQMVTVSKELRYYLEEKVGINPDNVRTVYNGIDVGVYCRTGDISLKLAELGINDGTRIVGTVGNLYPIKGQTYLLKAIPMILRESPDVVFLIIGRGDQEQSLKKEALSLGISNNVRFLGFRSDVPDLLDLMDVFTLPSLTECLPLSVLEAMAKSVPPVVTNVGGIREIIEDGKTGFIVPPANSEDLAEKISLLLNNKNMADSIGARASATVRSNFSQVAMLSQYEALYELLIFH